MLVWSPNPTAERLLLDWAREQEAQAIDSSSVQAALEEQHIVLNADSETEQKLRGLGRILGADRILVASVLTQSHPLYVLYSGYKEGHPRVTTLFDPVVTVRSFGVDGSTVYWNVTARGQAPSFVLEPAVTDLTQAALRRITCEADIENQWIDGSGCSRKQ